jgi:hypothetical protein
MIALVLERSSAVHLLDYDASGERRLWHVVIEACQELRTKALVDVAGLMAGSSSDEVAERLASMVDESLFRGVVYFSTLLNTWIVYEIENRRHTELLTSPLVEAQCFVYFDESRCRGSEMKLQNDACALVTLEPKMTKDKFLQGCARMRKLDRGQSLILAGTSEIVSPGVSVKGVVERIVRNTIKMTGKALPSFYERGASFATFPKQTMLDVTLETMYSNSIDNQMEFGFPLDATHESEEHFHKHSKLVAYVKKIGEGLAFRDNDLNQECEREIERENEEEIEVELEVMKQCPYKQVDWGFDAAFTSPEVLLSSSSVCIPLKDFVHDKLGNLSNIKWHHKLYCTHNFCRTIQAAQSSKDLLMYLRLVNSMLVLEDGRVILISVYELDKLLPFWWKKPKEPKAVLKHLSTSTSMPNQRGFGKEIFQIPSDVLVSIKLFRGYVDYPESEKEMLAAMFRKVTSPRKTIEELLFARNRLSFFDCSDLDNFAYSVDG